MQINVHNLPAQVSEQELARSTVIVIDLLRATSTICTAIANGAREVVPFLEIEDALCAAKAADRANVVLGGERSGGKIPGFDVGNSPAEYTREVVDGKRVFITTTNGTRAMHHARQASRVVLASFLNLSAVVASIKNERRIDLVCAGTDGRETGEDLLAAGAVVDRIATLERAPNCHRLNDEAAAAREKWVAFEQQAQASGRSFNAALAIALRETPGGRNLIGIGLDQDLVDCAQVDRFDLVPELDVRTWQIRLSHS